MSEADGGLPPYTDTLDGNNEHNKIENMEDAVSSMQTNQKSLADSIAGVLKIVTDQGLEQKAQNDKIMSKIETMNKDKTRSRAASKQSEGKHYRSTSNPESKGYAWNTWFTGVRKKDNMDVNKENKDLYPTVAINDSQQQKNNMDQFINADAFVRQNEPATPPPFTGSNIKKLYVPMPKDKIIETQNKSYIAELENYVDDDQYKFLTQSNARANEHPTDLPSAPNDTNQSGSRGYALPDQLGARPKNVAYTRNIDENLNDNGPYDTRRDALNDETQNLAQNLNRMYDLRRQNQEQRYPHEGRDYGRDIHKVQEKVQKQKAFSYQPQDCDRSNGNNGLKKDGFFNDKIRHTPQYYGRGAYGGFSYNDFETKMYPNRQNHQENIDMPSFKQSTYEPYNTKLVHETIKYLQHTVKVPLNKTSLMSYLRQFSILAHQNNVFTTIEYIHIVNSFVGNEMFELQSQHHVWLNDYAEDYEGFINMLRGLKSGFHITTNDVLSLLSEINPKNMSIFQLYLKVAEIVDGVDDKEWPADQKNEHLFYYIKRNISPSLRQSIDMLLQTNYYGRNIYPSKAAIKDFCLRAEKNMSMSQKRAGGYNVNLVHEEEEEPPTCVRNGDHDTRVRDNGGNGKNNDDRRYDNRNRNNGNRYRDNGNRDNNRYRDNGNRDNRYRDNGNNNRDNGYRYGNRQQNNVPDTSKYCESCQRNTNHTIDLCFYNPDRQIGHENQLKFDIRNCMLCKSRDHMALDCPVYPGEMPIFGFCQNCIARNIKAHHKTVQCKENKGN